MEKAALVPNTGAPSDLIKTAIASNADLDKLEKLLTLQERWEANEARKAYHKAMAQFKADPPKIDKDKTVAYGNTRYNHASLANVTDKIGSALSKYGLSASWTTKQNGAILVTCRITHVNGHSEETTLSAAADSSGAKNSIQAIGSTITYLERYTLLALTGLATYEQDDDGKVSESEFITEEQEVILQDNIVASGAALEKFLKYMKVESLAKITKVDYQKGIAILQEYKSRKEKKQ
jgi:hypothetical protein